MYRLTGLIIIYLWYCGDDWRGGLQYCVMKLYPLLWYNTLYRLVVYYEDALQEISNGSKEISSVVECQADIETETHL